MAEMEQFDGIVIGAGQAGGPLATALADAGWKMAIVEREHAGGTCVNEGCTPTKTMVASARIAHLARRADEYGVSAGPVSVDQRVIRQRKREIVEQWRAGSRSSLERHAGVTYVEGEASFVDERTVQVRLKAGGARRLRAARGIFINTGQRPRIAPLAGLEDVPYLTNQSIMELGETPEHLLILGGGYVSLEFGQMFRRFGSRVTIVEAAPRFLPREDEDVAQAMAGILQEEGIDIHVDAEATRVERGDDGTIRLHVKLPTGEAILAGSHFLMAVGRAPNTDALNLPAAGVETDQRGYIPTDERLETNVPGIYALGDVRGGAAFTHISYDDFRIVRDNLTRGANRTVDERLVPYTVFTDPQLAHVGLSESQAREAGYDIRVARLPMDRVARAIETGETRGFLKAIVDADTDQLLGCTMIGVEGGEMMSMVQIAMMGELPYTALRDGVFAHPLFAESLNNLFLALDREREQAAAN